MLRVNRLIALFSYLLLVLFCTSALSAQYQPNWYHYEQGMRMIKAREWQQASTEFNYYLRHPEMHGDMIGVAHYGLGEMYEAQNQWERAISEYRQALRNDLHDTFKVTGKVYVKLGALYSVTGKYQEGLDEFLRMLEKNDNNGAAHYFAGLFYLKLKQYDKALVHADRAKELGVRSTRIYDELKARK